MGYSPTKAKVGRERITTADSLVLKYGVCISSVQRALDDAKGVIQTAAIMLMSADEVEAAGGAVDPATGVDLANVVEGSSRRHRTRSNNQ